MFGTFILDDSKKCCSFSRFCTHLCPPFKMEEDVSDRLIRQIRRKNYWFFFPSLLKGRVRDGYKLGKETRFLIFAFEIRLDPKNVLRLYE